MRNVTSDEQEYPVQPHAKKAVPARKLTAPEFEAVIRRAVELQTTDSALSEDGVAEADVVRIGQELGLETSVIRRAIAEIRTRPFDDSGALAAFVGSGAVRAQRIVRHTSDHAARMLDHYLREVELMVVQRRLPECTRYALDSSIAAGISRMTQNFSRGRPALKFTQLDVAVSPIDSDSCLVELTVDLKQMRGGLAAGVLGSSSVFAAGWASAVWATTIPDPLMLAGIPVLGGAWAGMRMIYKTISRSTEEKMETLLDRLEHDEMD